MKNLKQLITCVVVLFLAFSCDQGIDGITAVEPGIDESAPAIKIVSPTEGTKIKVPQVVASVTIEVEVTDDIEVANVEVMMDDITIANFNEFKDYRRVLIKDLVYNEVRDGSHVLKVAATDIEGKTTVATVTFEKEPAYTPLFAGEVLYMPFDGDYVDLIGLKAATKTGTPTFAGQAVIGANAYKGAEDSYLNYPTAGLLGTEFTASFWYKVNASPDRAGLLVIGDNPDDRNQGFRLFREGNGASQTIKLNVGTGNGESWNDGGVLDVAAGEWVHIAFAISATKSTIFFNGVEMRSATLSAPVDWTGCENMVIGAGGDTFSYWNHLSDRSAMDELRVFNKALTAAEIQNMINVTNPYTGKYDGEMFYLPFDGNNKNLFNGQEAAVVGTPGVAGEGISGSEAYAGAANSYLTFPTDNLKTEEFSASFWYKVNASPDRAGILVMGPPDTERADYPSVQNLRTNGFRFFREGSTSNQIFKLNVGNGTADTWIDGGAAASLDPASAGWKHIAFTISGAKAIVYIDGLQVAEANISGVDWTGCDILSIGSGAPRFTEWGHLSDQSFIDELRLFNKALTPEEVLNIRNDE
ncbi:LamG-like jellyroll fold domain-containing protein [Sediminicola sp. 1XM1-17]|uniref:LamG-like jellyroll fold domain-containing protein n=1 Tax=Sediminicola sp. 1XM1-17 TaxID=3127702 RepID=UPI0030780008